MGEFLIHTDDGRTLSLEHHGILGQKWGVRRFQDINGNYTPEGRERYGLKAEGKARYAQAKEDYRYAKSDYKHNKDDRTAVQNYYRAKRHRQVTKKDRKLYSKAEKGQRKYDEGHVIQEYDEKSRKFKSTAIKLGVAAALLAGPAATLVSFAKQGNGFVYETQTYNHKYINPKQTKAAAAATTSIASAAAAAALGLAIAKQYNNTQIKNMRAYNAVTRTHRISEEEEARQAQYDRYR
ncbi:MAG: hypothetical protein IIZ07_08210 [Ruminococcus sp.]|nr:hypothetical protein [Ruminococcus sp.]